VTAESQRDLRVLLIGGSSHSGKSTLAQALAGRLGWDYRSTDKLARHPGRPWPTEAFIPPEHVGEYYLTLNVDELIVDVVRHYTDNVWPLVLDIVAAHANNPSADKLVLEGSALLPDLVATLPFDNVGAIWLTASDHLFGRRIYASSQYNTKNSPEKAMIDGFLARTRRYDDDMMAAVRRLGLASLNIEQASNMEELMGMCLTALDMNPCTVPVSADGSAG